MKAPVDVTYLADTVILLRYFEALGTVRRAMSIIKKRAGAHESTIREYRIDGRGLTIGDPLDGFQVCCAGFQLTSAKASPCWKSKSSEARRFFGTCRGSRADRARRLRRRGADQGGGYYANVCGDLAAMMHEIEGGAGLR